MNDNTDATPPQDPSTTGATPQSDSPGVDTTPQKDPSDWVTGDEPMTGPQASYLRTLCQEAGEPFDENMSKAAASRKIEELQSKTGRGEKGTSGS